MNKKTLGFDVIKDVCLNSKGHYLESDQTLDVMQSEYIYPDFYNRLSPGEWLDGKPEALKLAVVKPRKYSPIIFQSISLTKLMMRFIHFQFT